MCPKKIITHLFFIREDLFKEEDKGGIDEAEEAGDKTGGGC